MSSRISNLLLCTGLVGLGVYLVIESRSFSERSAMLPTLLAVCFIGAAVILLAAGIRSGTRAGSAGTYPFAAVPWGLWLGVVVAFILFALGVEVIGFYESAFLFLVVSTWLMSAGEPRASRRVASSLAFAIGFDAVIYLMFSLVLRVPTPTGILL